MQIRNFESIFDAVSSDEFSIAKGIPKNESPKICDVSNQDHEKRKKGREECEIGRWSPQEIPKEYLIAKFGFDTAESGPFKVWERKTGVQVMRRVRQVTNAARRNRGAQSDKSVGQGIIVPSTVRIYLFGAAVLS